MPHLARLHLTQGDLQVRNEVHEVDEPIRRSDENNDRERQVRDHLLKAEVSI